MKLENIGFYTLSNKRAKNISIYSDLQRCELILTNRCNFDCPYCRGIKNEYQGDLSLEQAKYIVDLWSDANLQNIRFSGGEPTIWEGLIELIKHTKSKSNIERIALSTNGSASIEFYNELFKAGVNDFSISLDACCANKANIMSGLKNLNFDHIVEVIKFLSDKTYVTVGVVLEECNISDLQSIIKFAHDLGVADIRIIPSAQYNEKLKLDDLSKNIVNKHPILKYRLRNIKKGVHVRGIQEKDSFLCSLVLDDMVILNNYHFPCIIYMRERGLPIGTVDKKTIEQIRRERYDWFIIHNSKIDKICKYNCLDVCIDHNNYCYKRNCE